VSLPAATALAITAAGLVAGALTLARTRSPSLAMSVLLDLLLAAGLLRLTGGPAWGALATIASIVAIRRLIGSGLRVGRPSWRPRTPAGPSRKGAVERLVRPAWRL